MQEMDALAGMMRELAHQGVEPEPEPEPESQEEEGVPPADASQPSEGAPRT